MPSASVTSSSWSKFLSRWKSLNKGFTLYSSTPTGIPESGHVFVVLGSGLKPNGGMSGKFLRRLKKTVAAAKACPNSKIIISGGAPKSGKTEAAVGYAYLKAQGIATSRLIRESASASTVGNARYSMAIIRSKGFTSYTIISDASHLRRAGALFAAAQMQLEQKYNKLMPVVPVKNVAFIDSRSAERKPSASEHSVIAYHCSLLLGVSKSYLLGRYNGGSVPTAAILRRGSTGTEVKELQRKLGISADGIFGPVTESAVKKFQKAKGLVVDGIVGPATRKALGL